MHFSALKPQRNANSHHVVHMRCSQNLGRHQKKQKKQTTRCTKHRQAPKKPKKTQFPTAISRSRAIVPGNFVFLFFLVLVQVFSTLHFVFFVFFGACAGLVTLTSQNIGRHQKIKKKQITFLRVIPTMTYQDMSGRIFGHILNIF